MDHTQHTANTVNATTTWSDFFSQSGFMPHGHCYLWKPGLVSIHVISDLLIGFAYVAISIILYSLIKKIKIQFSAVVLYFGVFIGACGLTHFMEIWTLWNPDYWASGSVKAVTALASVGTGIYLYRLRHTIVTIAEASKLAEQQRLDLEVLTEDLERRVEEKTRKLQESENWFRELANSVPQMTWLADAQGNITWYNDRWYEFTGIGFEQAGGWGWKTIHHPDYEQKVIAKWKQHIKTGENWEEKFPLRSKEGKFHWFLSRGKAFKNAEGQITHWIGTDTDITETLEYEEKLKASKEAAEKANLAKTQFLANMSHEIRTPMNSVLGYADLLSTSNLSEPERLSYSGRIKASGQHLLCLIDDILDLAKVETGHFKVQHEKFSIANLISECLDSISILARNKNINLELRFETPVPVYIDSDAGRIRQILMNLLSNAVKFTPDKGKITITLFFRSVNDEGLLTVEIEDTGIGIPPEKQNRLFRPFSQADESVTRRFGGTGLGLNLSRHLAQALGGNLELKWSTPDQGSCFAFSVMCGDYSKTKSIQSLEPKADKAKTPQATGLLNGIKVLVVDDSKDNQELLDIYLRREGASVTVADNGAEAITKVLHEDFDVILMDIAMPVMDGHEATQKLRQLNYKKPIIALTAHALIEEVEKSLRSGCNAHLSKPIDSQQLFESIRAQLEKVHKNRAADVNT